MAAIHLYIRAAADPYRNAFDLNFDRPDIRLGFASRCLASPAKNRRPRDRIHHCRTNCNSSASEAAASLNWRRQPNNCCGDNPWRRANRTDRVPACHDLRDNPRLSSWCHFRRRTGSGKDLQPPDRSV